MAFAQALGGTRSRSGLGAQRPALRPPPDRAARTPPRAEPHRPRGWPRSSALKTNRFTPPANLLAQQSTRASALPRSEERRVGKERRSRWSPSHSNKKKAAIISAENNSSSRSGHGTR